jgi:hypothetical protein
MFQRRNNHSSFKNHMSNALKSLMWAKRRFATLNQGLLYVVSYIHQTVGLRGKSKNFDLFVSLIKY